MLFSSQLYGTESQLKFKGHALPSGQEVVKKDRPQATGQGKLTGNECWEIGGLLNCPNPLDGLKR